MTREEARKAAEIMLAYAEGKEVEIKENQKDWKNKKDPNFNWCYCDYRIKSEPKLRPFQSAEECWQEMQKHQPFGWVKDKDGTLMLITRVEESQNVENDFIVWFSNSNDAAKGLFMDTTFADDAPFGVLEEEV